VKLDLRKFCAASVKEFSHREALQADTLGLHRNICRRLPGDSLYCKTLTYLVSLYLDLGQIFHDIIGCFEE
jgi:hypothetical protein